MPKSSWLEKAVSLSVLLAAPALAACSFGGADGDGDSDACYFTYAKLCGLSFNGPRKFTGASMLDTTKDSTCTKVIPSDAATGTPELCVISAKSIDVLADAAIRVTGKRPLVLAAEEFIRVAGTIDASSTRARTAADAGGAMPEVIGAGAESVTCTDFARSVVDNLGGGSGGAGGSFVGRGGNGGAGNTGVLRTEGGLPNPVTNSSTLAALRGGCRGQTGGAPTGNPNGGTAGAGGPPGGVLYLASRGMLSILETGKLGVNGGGGSGGGAQAGGGGGGSGGLIVLEALGPLRHTGLLSANGGAGGGGGQFDLSTPPGVARAGAGGNDGTIAKSLATGGAGQPGGTTGGDGATGGANTYDVASNGSDSQYGGGGAGGGVGWIHAIAPGAITGGGESSPPQQ